MPNLDGGGAWLPPLAVAVPIVAAAGLAALSRHLPRPAVDVVAIATSLSVVGLTASILSMTAAGRVVTWVGGWTPHHGFSVGIVLVSDPLGAALALLAAVLVTLALVFSWEYVQLDEGHFHALVLLFLAGMEGFALTGDLFDMFVFFELMGAAAYALTGIKIEERRSVQGAMNFGIVNSLGAYVALVGVGLVYSKTGNLGLPQIGRALAHDRPDALVVAAFVMVMTGFLVKGAMAPFHFWLADAHAVAPSPVCVLFSGVMVPLGLYGAFRVYWVAFGTILPVGDIRRTFVVLGVVTALVGALMCVSERNFKRLLAYSTIGHVGLFIVALGVLTAAGTAGAALYVAGHAGVKASLFLVGGVLLARYGSVDEKDLHGRGIDAGMLRWVAVAGGLALACLPPFGTALGKAVSEAAGSAAGYPWCPALFVAVSALTGGAVLRVVGRVFFGLGPVPPEDERQTTGEGEEREGPALERVPMSMWVPIGMLLGGALVMGLLPGVHEAALRAGAAFVDGGGYRRQALAGAHLQFPGAGRTAAGPADWDASGVLLDLLSAALAVGVAALAIWFRVVVRRPFVGEGARRLLSGFRYLHSGHIGDYVAWLMVGLVVLAVFVGLPLVRPS